jgi:pimeloyl-ACP methyl ester carboxylesterase
MSSAAALPARDPYWMQHYVVESDPNAIAAAIDEIPFRSGGESFELLAFRLGKDRPSVLISPGSAGHAYVFAELAFRLQLRGFNVFIMPKQGGYTIDELVRRHEDALACVRSTMNDRVGVFGEGLGGYVAFYLALAGAPLRSLVCQNSPAVLTESAFHRALLEDDPAARRRRWLIPIGRAVSKVAPRLKLPIRSYLDFEQMVDEKSRATEGPIVSAYACDPDFDRSYPISAAMSLLTTPAPRPLQELAIPTMFMVPVRGVTPGYIHDLFDRLPSQGAIEKKLVELDGGVFWMVSHPTAAAGIIGDWFDRTIPSAAASTAAGPQREERHA